MNAFLANASLADAIHTLAGIVMLAPLVFVPGYLLNRLTRVLGDRDASALDSIGAALALSIGAFPVFIYLLGRLAMPATRAFFWASIVAFLALIWIKRAQWKRSFSAPELRIPIILACLWAVFALLSQIDWQWGNHVYPSSIIYDDWLRVGLIGGLARTHSLPPPDPFVHVGTSIPLGYHYFWFLLSSLVCREFPNSIGPRGALMAGVIWTGLMLWAVLSLWLRILRKEREWASFRWTVAALLLAISGLDVLVFVASVTHRLLTHDPHWIPYATLDWWSFDQITNWIDILVWVPHCAAALGACATGLLILLNTVEPGWKRRSIRAFVAGACFASSVGLSIYVAFGFVLFFAAYFVLLIARRRSADIATLAIAGAVAALLIAPFLLELTRHAPEPSFFYVGFRRPGEIIWRLTHKAGQLAGRILYPPAIALTLFLEFGFFAAALWYWWRRRPAPVSSGHRSTLILLLLVPLLITGIVRADAFGGNELGMRGIFAAQFALAVIAGEWLLSRAGDELPPPRLLALLERIPRPALVLLILGLVTTGTEAALLRTFTMFQESGHVQERLIATPDVGLTTESLRDAYDWLRRHSPPSAIVQSNPEVRWDFPLGLYADRQSVVAGTASLNYRAYRPQIQQAIDELSALFDSSGKSAPDPDQLCARWGINYFVVTSTDPVWANPHAWIWRRSPIYANSAARVYACEPPRSASGTDLSGAGAH